MPGAAAAENKHSLSWGTDGFHSRCRETEEANPSGSVLARGCTASKALPARQRKKGTLILSWENATILHPKVLGCGVLFVMVWSVLLCPDGGGWGDFGKEGMWHSAC